MSRSNNIFSRLKRKLPQHSSKIKLTLLLAGLGLGIFFLYSLVAPLTHLVQTLLKGPSAIISFTQDASQNLKTTQGRTNILLLGMGGEGHEGALLTDSIIVISYNHDQKTATLISLPRDLWVDSLKTKINAVYYYGEQKQAGGGLILAKSAVAEITDLPIHYGFAINFDGFKEAIDLVGGVDVDIKRTFDDYRYPIPGMENAYPEELRYEHLHFDAGLAHLDGELALKYVRSRHAQGEEGTDFARSQRQQQVLIAFKDKLISSKTLLDLPKINQLLGLYQVYIDTDILDTEYASFAKIALNLKSDKIHSISLATDDSKTGEIGILEVPQDKQPYQNQWVLIAKDNNWNALKLYIQNQLNQQD